MFQQNLREEGAGRDLDPQEVVSRSTDVMGQGRNLTAGKGCRESMVLKLGLPAMFPGRQKILACKPFRAVLAKLQHA